MKFKEVGKDYIWTIGSVDKDDLKNFNKKMTIAEIARMYRVSASTIRNWMENFEMKPEYRLGDCNYCIYDRDDCIGKSCIKGHKQWVEQESEE